jgi:broad specificity phosphatase PhoE
MRRAIAAATILLAVGVCAAPPSAAAQQVIFLMRHAEQSADPDEPVLTEAGHRRAAGLVARLKDAGIDVIYTSDAKRTVETATPIARALGITPKVMPRRAIESLINEVRMRHPRERVLIVNHALNLPALLKALGHPGEVRVALDDYEPIFMVIPRPDGPPVVVLLRY